MPGQSCPREREVFFVESSFTLQASGLVGETKNMTVFAACRSIDASWNPRRLWSPAEPSVGERHASVTVAPSPKLHSLRAIDHFGSEIQTLFVRVSSVKR